jgi:hypothetical protein
LILSFANEENRQNLQFTNFALNKELKSITLAPYWSKEQKAIIKVDNPKNVFFKLFLGLIRTFNSSLNAQLILQ